MKKLGLLFLIILCSTSIFAQFEIEKYKNYLINHKDMTPTELLNEYPAGKFLKEAPNDFLKADFAIDISQRYTLTEYEKSLISKNGFMVSERLNYYTFIQAFWDVYTNDLPIYVSSDAILHALHFNFDKILKACEIGALAKNLDIGIDSMKKHVSTIAKSGTPDIYQKAVNDLDIYLTVTQQLLKDNSGCSFPENNKEFESIIKLIETQQLADIALFSNTKRTLDFSQFTPRGHYVVSDNDNQGRILPKYFQAMTWLGRTEILLSNPKNSLNIPQSDEDLQRMAILSALISETAIKSGANKNFEIIDSVLSFLIGRQDNINLKEISQTLKALSFSAYDLCEKRKCKIFVDKLKELSSSTQLYNSQILFSDPLDPNQAVPPSTFLLMGQRPIIDGFITANVVYDRIIHKGTKIIRMVPSTQDILFSIGNDASIQLLQDELNVFPYSSNLASLRYLIDSYDSDFWKSSTYTCWLNSIKSLNPPKQRDSLPMFMQTAAWWQKTMNTQLASWSELRHDFLLYAKQPYTESLMCSYPHAYIEPVPELFKNISIFFESLKKLANTNIFDSYLKWDINSISNHWINVCSNLESMAKKELNKEEFSTSEKDFICSTIKEGKICDPTPGADDLGWYIKLYSGIDVTAFNYNYKNEGKGLTSDQFTVADVHTIPTDEAGNMVGWVLHAGTGRINMAVINAPTIGGGNRAFIGPVSSYYEFISNDFKRLTNDEWRQMDGAPAYRPAFTNLYLANKNGDKPNGAKLSLFTNWTSVTDDTIETADNIYLNCSPNPFSTSIVISFSLSKDMVDKNVELNIFDIKGNIIKSLINQKLFQNNFSFIWDGLDNMNNKVQSGTYICSIKIGDKLHTCNISLVK